MIQGGTDIIIISRSNKQYKIDLKDENKTLDELLLEHSFTTPPQLAT